MSAFLYAESAFLDAVHKNGMLPLLQKGCAVGFSGGADSVLLVTLLKRLAERTSFPLCALHVEHGIRGAEAQRDEAFCRTFAEERGIAYAAFHYDVPSLAKERGEGIEAAARRVRYEAFETFCAKEGYACVLTAHHATDSAETVLLHMVRGAGTNGLCGIRPMRKQNEIFVLRPLLSLSRGAIEAAVKEAELPYVTDSTNADTAYRRNYVREKILPSLRELNPAVEGALTRLSDSLAQDEDFLSGEAEKHLAMARRNDGLEIAALTAMHPAMQYRVVSRFYEMQFPDAPHPEKTHVEALLSRARKNGAFAVCFPADIEARGNGEIVRFCPKNEKNNVLIEKIPIHMGENTLSDGARLCLVPTSEVLCSNVYNLSIRRSLSSATMVGELYVRGRNEGDAYRFGGVTHKVKKLLSDAKLSLEERERLPVLCDDKGILWVPHCGVREDGGGKNAEKDLTLCYFPSFKMK